MANTSTPMWENEELLAAPAVPDSAEGYVPDAVEISEWAEGRVPVPSAEAFAAWLVHEWEDWIEGRTNGETLQAAMTYWTTGQ